MFSGTGSIENAISARFPGAEFVTVDIDERFEPTHQIDAVLWTGWGREGSSAPMHQYPRHYFDVVWCSPPCTEYSLALTSRERRMEEADKNVLASWTAIAYFQPKYFFVENPRGLLRTREIMAPYAKYLQETSYCQYGAPYRKHTDVWTNAVFDAPLEHCNPRTPCVLKDKLGKHPVVAQHGAARDGTPGSKSAVALYPVPARLVDALLAPAYRKWQLKQDQCAACVAMNLREHEDGHGRCMACVGLPGILLMQAFTSEEEVCGCL